MAEISTHLEILKRLQSEAGLFMASRPGVSTGYDKTWIRDHFYATLAFIELEQWETVRKAWRALLDVFLKHENKISWAVREKPLATYQYIHARYHPETFDEYWEEWGNKQHDAIGASLFMFGRMHDLGHNVVESEADRRIVQKLIDYLERTEYFKDPDNGVWEEAEELHTSSIGAAVAGLSKVRSIEGVNVPEELITRGREALDSLLPRESKSKFTDLAQLSLMWPFELLSKEHADQILTNLTYHLERRMGIVRYKNDRYYNKNIDGVSEEAEWTFGFPWLAIIYADRGDTDRARSYLDKAERTITDEGIPELYLSNSDKRNENVPLAWAESLYIVARNRVGS